MSDNKNILRTRDGSQTLFVESKSETYHSKHGALQESKYVYINKGLDYWWSCNPQATRCRVFEMGFGTGLNALLAARYALTSTHDIYFESVENDPLPLSTHQALGLFNHFDDLGDGTILLDSLTEKWNTPHQWFPNFRLYKNQIDYFQWHASHTFDIIFYDAFGAHAQGEMWEIDALQRAVACLDLGGVWVSYCAKGSVRRNLKSLGLEVARLPGPPGKREMLRAIKVE